MLEGGARVKSMNEAKAAENEEEKKASADNAGWLGMENKSSEPREKEEQKKPQAKSGGINFDFKKKGPPMFTKKKGIGVGEEAFPELGEDPGSKAGGAGP